MSYCTVADVKSVLSIEDTDDDLSIQRAVDTATTLIDKFTNRNFDAVDTADPAATTSRLYTASGPTLVILDDAAAVDTVEERRAVSGSFDTVDADDWQTEPANAVADGWPIGRLRRVVSSWPDTPQGVRVTAWFGWSATPEAVTQACVMQAERILKEAKEAPLGIAPIAGFEGTSLRMMNRLHPQVEVIVGGYRRNPTVAPA